MKRVIDRKPDSEESETPVSKKPRKVSATEKAEKPLLYAKKGFQDAYRRWSPRLLPPSTTPYGPHVTVPITYDKSCDSLYEDVLGLIGEYLDAPSRADASMVSKLWKASMDRLGSYKTLHSRILNIHPPTGEYFDIELGSMEDKTYLVTHISNERVIEPHLKAIPAKLQELGSRDPTTTDVYIEEDRFFTMNPLLMKFYKMCRKYETLSLPPIRIVLMIFHVDAPYRQSRPFVGSLKTKIEFQIHPIVFTRYRDELRSLVSFFIYATLKFNPLQDSVPRRWHPVYSPPQTSIVEPSSDSASSISLHDYQKDGVSWMLSVEEAVWRGDVLNTSLILPFRGDGDPRIAAKLSIKENKAGQPTINFRESRFVDARDAENDVHVQYKGGILADCVGMGKTLEILALIASSCNSPAFRGFQATPTLVISPMHILHQWEQELVKFYPSMSYALLYDRDSHEALSKRDLHTVDVVIVSSKFFHVGHYPALIIGDEYNTSHSQKVRASLIPSLLAKEAEYAHNTSQDRNNRGFLMMTQVHWRRIVMDEAHSIATGCYADYFLSLRADTYWWVSATALDCSKDLLFRFLRINAVSGSLNTNITTTDPVSGHVSPTLESLLWPGSGESEPAHKSLNRLLLLKTFYATMKNLFRRGNVVAVPRMTITRVAPFTKSHTYSQAVVDIFENMGIFSHVDVLGPRHQVYDTSVHGYPNSDTSASDLNLVSPYQRALLGRIYDVRGTTVFLKRLRHVLGGIGRGMSERGLARMQVDLSRVVDPLFISSARQIARSAGLTFTNNYREFIANIDSGTLPSTLEKLETFLSHMEKPALPSPAIMCIPHFLKEIYPKSISYAENGEGDFLNALFQIYGPITYTKLRTVLMVHKVESNRILVFGYAQVLLNIVKQVLNTLAIEVGDATRENKRLNEVYRRFNSDDPDMRVILLKRNAMGTGTTLSAATHMIFLDGKDEYDAHGNQENYEQCLGRAHRYGQRNNVEVIHFADDGDDVYNKRVHYTIFR